MTTERIMLTLMLAGVAYGCGTVLWPFLSAILWAAILTFTTWPFYVRLRARMNSVIAALLVIIACTIAILLPLSLLISTSISDIPPLVRTLSAELARFGRGRTPAPWIAKIPLFGTVLHATIERWVDDVQSFGTSLKPYAGQIARYVIATFIGLAKGLFELVMALFVTVFFLINGDALGRVITAILTRVTGGYAHRLISVIGSVVRGTVYGILGTAIVQGVLTAIGLLLVKIPDPVILGGLAAFVAVFPVGAPIVWIPAAVWLFSHGAFARAMFLVIYGIVFISGADHLIRPAFVARGAQLPYLLTVLGVLGGVVTLGALGIFLGPVLLGVGYRLTTEFARGNDQSHHVPHL